VSERPTAAAGGRAAQDEGCSAVSGADKQQSEIINGTTEE